MIRTHYGQHDSSCFGCRVRSVQLAPSRAFQPHYNDAVGQFVSSDREFRDALKRCAEHNSISTGINHEYEPRYPGDTTVPYPEADGVLDTRAKNMRELSNG